MRETAGILLLMICLILTSCSTAEDNQNKTVKTKPLVVIITDVGGIGDASFNDAVLSSVEKVQKDEEFDTRFLEARNITDYDYVLKEALGLQPKIIIAVGSNMAKSVEVAAKANPKMNYGIVDAAVKFDNVKSLQFADNESAFLAGFIAASKTKTGTIGFVGGEDRETVSLFFEGYAAGAKVAKPDVKIQRDFVGSFYDPKTAEKVTDSLVRSTKADVVMHLAGPSGVGVIKSAKKNSIWAIGADKDQSKLASQTVLCSAIKEMDGGISKMIKSALKDKYDGEILFYDMKDEGVDISDNAGNTDSETMNKVEKLKKAIKDGKIKVPKTQEERMKFKMPDGIL
ncbi:MAG: BMP family ABC transporter substrate-binding protein [Eubacteriales bacterium]|nr:BMP family ABC transporter substrate-binding protein [Eubacteriales bacterium]MDY3332820.1 BMP family ABC transporter substrate-binding protein [Gallibacter sp.]